MTLMQCGLMIVFLLVVSWDRMEYGIHIKFTCRTKYTFFCPSACRYPCGSRHLHLPRKCMPLAFVPNFSGIFIYKHTHTFYYTYKIYCLPTRQVLTNLQTFLKALAELGCEQFLVSDLQGSQYFRGRVPRCDTSPHKFALKLIVKAYESYKYVMLVHFLIPQTVWPH